MQSVRFSALEEFFEISSDSDASYEYTVAWLDCVSSGRSFGRGIFMRGNHSPAPLSKKRRELTLGVPFDLPEFVLNRASIKAFNFLYYNKQRSKVVKTLQHYEPFFYPLDSIHSWNRIYGKRGL